MHCLLRRDKMELIRQMDIIQSLHAQPPIHSTWLSEKNVELHRVTSKHQELHILDLKKGKER